MIRRCLPDLPVERGWCSFVNAVDGTGALPGTSLTGDPGHRRLSGWKTWLAAADHADRLLVTARQGEPPLIVVRRDQPGVRIESGRPKGYLSELVQGRVEFADVSVREDQLIGDEAALRMLGRAETAYIRAALNAFILSHARRLDAPPALTAAGSPGRAARCGGGARVAGPVGCRRRRSARARLPNGRAHT